MGNKVFEISTQEIRGLAEGVDLVNFETNDPGNTFGKDIGLVYVSFGDGKQSKSQLVSLSGKRLLDFFIERTFDRHKGYSKKEALAPQPFHVSELLKVSGCRSPKELSKIMENFNGMPVRTDIFGSRARKKARELMAEIPQKRMTEEQKRTFLQARAMEVGSSLLSFRRISVHNPEEDVFQKKRQSNWATDDLIVIEWGQAVKELIEEPSSIYTLTSRAEKQAIRSKHAYALFDILKAEIFRQRGCHDLGTEKIYTRGFRLDEAHQLLATDMKEDGYWRTHPFFDPKKPPFDQTGVKDGGLRYFKKEILVPACTSINRDTQLKVTFAIDPGRSRDRKIYFVLESTDVVPEPSAELNDLENQIASAAGLADSEARAVCALAAPEVINRALIEYQAEKQLKEAKGERIMRPKVYLLKIIHRLSGEAQKAPTQDNLFGSNPLGAFVSKSEEKACRHFAALHADLQEPPIGIKQLWARYSLEQKIEVGIEQGLQGKTDAALFYNWIRSNR